MFTGIVEEVGSVASVPADGLAIAAAEVLKDIKLGDSIAVNGVCLTVKSFDAKSFTVDVMPETLRRTNLGRLRTGDRVNLERAVALGGRMGGHLVQGHVDDTGSVSSINVEGAALLMSFAAPPGVMRYVVPKGFIAVDGVSLTIASREAGTFTVSLVGYTREHTVLGARKTGDVVNLEVDIIAKYVEQLSQPDGKGVTAEFLQEHGFTINTRS